MEETWVDDLTVLLDALPEHIVKELNGLVVESSVLEIVMDLGRLPEARFPNDKEFPLGNKEVTPVDLDYVASQIGMFNEDNRAGIERTLHRISAIRNRQGNVIGITCRVGRSIIGTMNIIRDIVESGKSILLVGHPGVGKTTMLREIARVLADDLKKRVVIVDTSNEIAGDGDIPHPAIGHARRMQVQTPQLQHRTMIEAVENHMPQVIIIDEIGTEMDAAAARTIAERGVQLVATAHGNTLENLIMNPTLSDLVGGIQSVTLGDREAHRRRTQKSVLERKAPPTFDVLVEIQSWQQVAVHSEVARTVDTLLRGATPRPTIRNISPSGEIQEVENEQIPNDSNQNKERPFNSKSKDARDPKVGDKSLDVKDLYPYGISRTNLEAEIRTRGLPIRIVDRIENADILLTTKQQFRKRTRTVTTAEEAGISLFVLRNNSRTQLDQALGKIAGVENDPDISELAIKETEDAVERILNGEDEIILTPQDQWIRRLQHELANRYNLKSKSSGHEPNRKVHLSTN
jgi:stage III sporulation protein SpoIIIAA